MVSLDGHSATERSCVVAASCRRQLTNRATRPRSITEETTRPQKCTERHDGWGSLQCPRHKQCLLATSITRARSRSGLGDVMRTDSTVCWERGSWHTCYRKGHEDYVGQRALRRLGREMAAGGQRRGQRSARRAGRLRRAWRWQRETPQAIAGWSATGHERQCVSRRHNALGDLIGALNRASATLLQSQWLVSAAASRIRTAVATAAYNQSRSLMKPTTENATRATGVAIRNVPRMSDRSLRAGGPALPAVDEQRQDDGHVAAPSSRVWSR